MVVVNWGSKAKKICDASIDLCTNCNHLSSFEIHELKKNARVLFIPLISWDKKYYLVCLNCTAGFNIKEEFVQETLLKYSNAPSHDLSYEIFKKIEIKASKNHADYKHKTITEIFDETNISLVEEGYRKDDVEFISVITQKYILFLINKEEN